MNEFRDSSPSGLVQRRHFPEEREEEVEKRREEEGDGGKVRTAEAFVGPSGRPGPKFPRL